MSSYLIIAVIVLVMVAVLLGAVEVGYRRGLHTRPDEQLVSHATAWEAALLGMLALLIGFTFAMAVTRFDRRRDLILDEANAIESVSLRAQYLDPPLDQRVKALLVPYVDARIRYYQSGVSWKETMHTHQQAVTLQRQLWDQVVAAVRARPDSESVAAFVESADELIRAEKRRRASLDNHVPLPVFVVLLVVAATGMAATGYSCGLHRRRLPLGMILMPVLIVLVVALVFDLDYPRAGIIRAGQGALLRLRQEM
jgi:hypothetical protein